MIKSARTAITVCYIKRLDATHSHEMVFSGSTCLRRKRRGYEGAFTPRALFLLAHSTAMNFSCRSTLVNENVTLRGMDAPEGEVVSGMPDRRNLIRMPRF